MSAIDQKFKDLKSANKKAFIPFITAGDPDLETTRRLVAEFDKIGCSIAEIGIPYSDPIADGPVIQASYSRALDKGIKFEQISATIKDISKSVSIPLVMMVSYSIVFRKGSTRFVEHAKSVGVAGLIVPDLPFEEAAQLAKICAAQDVSLIQLVTPTTSRDRAIRIAETSSGFLYYVSVTGITGERTEIDPNISQNVEWIRSRCDLPICIGFGISKPEHVTVLSPIADGLIVGSAIVRKVAASKEKPEQEVLPFVQSLLDAIV